jgi:hypothetical protein
MVNPILAMCLLRRSAPLSSSSRIRLAAVLDVDAILEGLTEMPPGGRGQEPGHSVRGSQEWETGISA